MRYSEKFPNTPCDILMKEFDCCMIKVPTPGLCFVCGSPTHWVDIDYQGYLCSEECGKRAIEDAARLAKRERSEMKLLWLDGDEVDSWDELIEHLCMIGVTEPYDDGFYLYKGRPFLPDELIEVLKPLVELNAQLYDAWGLLYEFKDLDVPHSMELFKEKVKAYLENPIAWREKE